MTDAASQLKEFISAERGRVSRLAEFAGVWKQMVYRWASGERRPSDENKVAIEQFTQGAVPFDAWRPKLQSNSPEPVIPPASGASNKRLNKDCQGEVENISSNA